MSRVQKTPNFKTVIIDQVTMDTCLTASIMGLSSRCKFNLVIGGNATNTQLYDTRVLCINVGGHGLTDLYNFNTYNDSDGNPLVLSCEEALETSNGVRITFVIYKIVQFVAAYTKKHTQNQQNSSGNYNGSTVKVDTIFNAIMDTQDLSMHDKFLMGLDFFGSLYRYSVDPFDHVKYPLVSIKGLRRFCVLCKRCHEDITQHQQTD